MWAETVGLVAKLSCPNQNLTARQVVAKRFCRGLADRPDYDAWHGLKKRVATVDDQDRAGHERGRIRGKVDHAGT